LACVLHETIIALVFSTIVVLLVHSLMHITIIASMKRLSRLCSAWNDCRACVLHGTIIALVFCMHGTIVVLLVQSLMRTIISPMQIGGVLLEAIIASPFVAVAVWP